MIAAAFKFMQSRPTTWRQVFGKLMQGLAVVSVLQVVIAVAIKHAVLAYIGVGGFFFGAFVFLLLVEGKKYHFKMALILLTGVLLIGWALAPFSAPEWVDKVLKGSFYGGAAYLLFGLGYLFLGQKEK